MRAVAAAAAFVVLVLGAAPTWAAASGVVRVHNRSDLTVTVYVLNVDFYGNRSWRPLHEVPPRSYLDLPNVPAGTMVGAQHPKLGRKWPQARVEYSNGRPIFEYVISR